PPLRKIQPTNDQPNKQSKLSMTTMANGKR
ncbi:MAG: hypothetical protein ACI8RD_004534, partial [Bacillariaceae sp.]